MPSTTGRAPVIREIVASGAKRLEHAGISSAQLDARLIVAQTLGGGLANVITMSHDPVSANQLEEIEAALARRQMREPLAHILGEKEFWSLPFVVSPDVLTPRPDSETLVESACRQAGRMTGARILDLGTGSGCLLLALLSELPDSYGIGIDISANAAAVAHTNAVRLKLDSRASFCVGNWAEPISARFDLLVSNPPYIGTAEIATLEPEVAVFEPHSALDGGIDGLDAYRALLPQAVNLMAPSGKLLLEVGAGQAQAVVELAKQEGLETIAVDRDIANIDRCVILANSPQ